MVDFSCWIAIPVVLTIVIIGGGIRNKLASKKDNSDISPIIDAISETFHILALLLAVVLVWILFFIISFFGRSRSC